MINLIQKNIQNFQINNYFICSNLYIRISSIILLYSGLLAFNVINIPAVGSGIGLFNDLFHLIFINEQIIYLFNFMLDIFSKYFELLSFYFNYYDSSFPPQSIEVLLSASSSPFIYTLEKQSKLNPWFVTGFCDGESSFHIGITKRKELKVNWAVKPKFQIHLHLRDEPLLISIKQFFCDVGSIIQDKEKNSVFYSVNRLQDLKDIIIPHFLNFPLVTQKKADFILFSLIISKLINKEHLTLEGLHQILNIKCAMGLKAGISDKVKAEFNKITPVERPLILIKDIPSPNWIAGFRSAEGGLRPPSDYF
jgi:hypothetical protein